MSLLILATAGSVVAYPFDKIVNIDLNTSEHGEIHHAQVSVRVDGRSAAITPYSEKGDASVVKDAEVVYRKILTGMTTGKVVNLSDFALTQPKPKTKPKEPAPDAEKDAS